MQKFVDGPEVSHHLMGLWIVVVSCINCFSCRNGAVQDLQCGVPFFFFFSLPVDAGELVALESSCVCEMSLRGDKMRNPFLRCFLRTDRKLP